MAHVPATILVEQYLISGPAAGNAFTDETTRRYVHGTPGERSELITAFLKIITNPSLSFEHRSRAILRVSNPGDYIPLNEKDPLVVDALIAIVANENENRSLRLLAVQCLPVIARHYTPDPGVVQQAHSVLVQLINKAEFFDSHSTRSVDRIIQAIGACGPIGTNTLFKLWNNNHDIPEFRSYFESSLKHAFGKTRDVRSLDFLVSLVDKADLQDYSSVALFAAFRPLATHFQNTAPPDLPPLTDVVSLSKIRSALRKGLKPENDPSIIFNAIDILAMLTPKGDMATISHLRNFLPYVNESNRAGLERYLQKLETSDRIAVPKLMDRVPLPPRSR